MKESAKNRDWIWQADDWSFFKNKDFLAKAEQVDRAEKELNAFSLRLSAEDTAWTLVDDIVSNWAIENICLNREAIHNLLASILNLSHIDKIREKEREKNAVKATYEALFYNKPLSEALFYNKPLSLEYILYLHKLIQSDDGSDWGVIRNHAECVYGVDVNGKIYVVYDAPPHKIIPKLMEKFIVWWNCDSQRLPRTAASILAHLLFVTIHPFRDGNGRIARILSDKYMANGTRSRIYSISHEIAKNRTGYYIVLESITKEDGIGVFLDFMLSMYHNAIDQAKKRCAIIAKAYNFFSHNKIFLCEYEKDLLRMLSTDTEKFWSFIDATKYFSNGEQAEKAWSKFNKLGILNNGKFVIPDTNTDDEGNCVWIRKQQKNQFCLRNKRIVKCKETDL